MSSVLSKPIAIQIRVPESPASTEEVEGIVRRALDVIIVRLDNIDNRVADVDGKIGNLRDDMKEGFRKIQGQIESIDKKIDQINLRGIEDDTGEARQ